MLITGESVAYQSPKTTIPYTVPNHIQFQYLKCNNHKGYIALKMAESSSKRTVLLAVDGSKQAEQMVDCEYLFIFYFKI